MIQKTTSIILAILALWIFQRYYSLFAVIPIIIAVLMYRGADHDMWFYFDWDSDSSFGDDSDSGCGGD